MISGGTTTDDDVSCLRHFIDRTGSTPYRAALGMGLIKCRASGTLQTPTCTTSGTFPSLITYCGKVPEARHFINPTLQCGD